MFWAIILLGTALRLWLASVGYNFDMDSYWIVSQIVADGKSVYAETWRYNYGPIWSYVIYGIRWLTKATGNDNITRFHLLVCALLTIVDGTLALLVRNRYGLACAAFFFLNPISLLITGYHSQFDNFAILVGFIACSIPLVANSAGRHAEYKRACILGVSLAVKHLLFLFPIWLLPGERTSCDRLRRFIPLLAYFIFITGFLPFCLASGAADGILHNVLGYSSQLTEGAPGLIISLLFGADTLALRPGIAAAKGMFFAILMLSAGPWRTALGEQRDHVEYLFLYLITLVATSCAMADQYVSIPLIAVARYYRSMWAWFYVALGTATILGGPNNVFQPPPSLLSNFKYFYAQLALIALLIGIWRGRAKIFATTVPM